MKIGDKISQSFTISSDVHQGFTDLFNDRNPLHVDSAYANEKGFKSTVVQGNVLGGFLSYFIGESLPIKNVIILSQSINYHKPIFVGDELVLEGIVKDVVESVGMVDIKYFFRNQDKVKVAKGSIQIKVLE